MVRPPKPVSVEGGHVRTSKAIPFTFHFCMPNLLLGQHIITMNEGAISFRLFREKSKHSLQT